jgi:uncharacterized membrane protein SpoIIM required for sporulation
VILDADRFLANERAAWEELERILVVRENNAPSPLTVAELERLHYLYLRAASGLARLRSNSGDPAAVRHVESLVARAYAEVHQSRAPRARFRPVRLLTQDFPRAFRRHFNAFLLSAGMTLAGAAFGGAALLHLPNSRPALMPMATLLEKPTARVAREESTQAKGDDPLRNQKSAFAAELMTHNIQVAILTLAMGVTWGAGVVVLLFYNGVTLGAVICDYLRDGQAAFVMGWLMPHGVIEIPAILVGGQAGFVLAAALVGWRSRESRRRRMAQARGEIAFLAAGMAAMLVWAGIVEAFVSQYHQPVLPYGFKITLGAVELLALVAWLARGGSAARTSDPEAPNGAAR